MDNQKSKNKRGMSTNQSNQDFSNAFDTTVEIHPLTPDRWDDLTTLFGKAGADGGCWCMYWCMTQRDYSHSNRYKNDDKIRSYKQKMTAVAPSVVGLVNVVEILPD
ncbi:MAG: hypothetical protein ACE5JP_10280 [Candidatus Bipolaricaulia bacterium]